ncbi:MAG: thioredoxin [Lachnospiraceae bacterium]|nr:thioredoxin [Lachnospiraceae bacterium]MBR4144548.1 thioredoxin [Lachnospiraceae bacterium]MBR4781871.1 thioredoxin [Lachnospiraceae bacterium]MBR6475101.1 thioredoxin [Lachnospiraceae bacterium]
MSKDNLKTLIGLLLIVIALLLINIGIISGDVGVLETKSTNICLECIGIE